MSGRVHYQENTIEEVFDFFIDAFETPAGVEVLKVTPHYDPRKGTVIFEIYLEGDPIPAEAPASDL